MMCFKCGAAMPDDAYFCGICSAKLRDKHFDTIRMLTPHGGVKSEVRYFDADHQPCVKEKAWHMEIKEFDADGKEVYAFTAHKKPINE